MNPDKLNKKVNFLRKIKKPKRRRFYTGNVREQERLRLLDADYRYEEYLKTINNQ